MNRKPPYSELVSCVRALLRITDDKPLTPDEIEFIILIRCVLAGAE